MENFAKKPRAYKSLNSSEAIPIPILNHDFQNDYCLAFSIAPTISKFYTRNNFLELCSWVEEQGIEILSSTLSELFIQTDEKTIEHLKNRYEDLFIEKLN